MIKRSEKWLAVEEKLAELQKIVDENWDKGEWELAVLGTGVIRVVEQSKVNAMEMRQRADEFSTTFKSMLQRHEGALG